MRDWVAPVELIKGLTRGGNVGRVTFNFEEGTTRHD